MHCKNLIPVWILTFSASALALDYPTAFHGKYVYSGGDCKSPLVVIEKSQRFNDVDVTCTLKAVNSASRTKLVAEERCNREGREWSQKAVFEIEKGMLKLAEGKDQQQFRLCGSPVTSSKPADPASTKIMTCKVNPGQAGVTTFLDSNLTKTGSMIRDFDGYTFKTTGKIQVKKIEVIVGQLVRVDGTVSELKSYAMFDEWDCR